MVVAQNRFSGFSARRKPLKRLPELGYVVHPTEYVFSGVRPSSGAAASCGREALEGPNTLVCADVAAPEDGRSPLAPSGTLNTYPTEVGC